MASAELRLQWTKEAVADRQGLSVDDLELRRVGPSYTVDTVREIAARIAPERPVFLIGDDAFALFATWRAPEELLTLAHFAVMKRPPGVAGTLHEWLPETLRQSLEIADDGESAVHAGAGTWIRIVPIDALPISSSEVRAQLREGRSVRYLIPEAVREAVEASGVYAGSPPMSQAQVDNEEQERSDRIARVAEAAYGKKAEGLVALDVRALTSYADTLVIATGNSDRHTRSIADAVVDALRESGHKPLGVEGYDEGRWVLIDGGDLIVHVFQADVREDYDLERLWSDAPSVTLSEGESSAALP